MSAGKILVLATMIIGGSIVVIKFLKVGMGLVVPPPQTFTPNLDEDEEKDNA